MPISLSNHRVRASMAVIDPASIREFLPPSQSPCRDRVPPSHTSWHPRESIPPPGAARRSFPTGGVGCPSHFMASSLSIFSYSSNGHAGTWVSNSSGGGPDGTLVPPGVQRIISQSSSGFVVGFILSELGGGGGLADHSEPTVFSFSSISCNRRFNSTFSSWSWRTTSRSRSLSNSSCTSPTPGAGPSVGWGPTGVSAGITPAVRRPSARPASPSITSLCEIHLPGVRKMRLSTSSVPPTTSLPRDWRLLDGALPLPLLSTLPYPSLGPAALANLLVSLPRLHSRRPKRVHLPRRQRVSPCHHPQALHGSQEVTQRQQLGS